MDKVGSTGTVMDRTDKVMDRTDKAMDRTDCACVQIGYQK